MKQEFRKELEHLINKHSIDGQMMTPDFIIAKFVVDSLEALEENIRVRHNWFQQGETDSLYVTNPDGTVELVDDMGEVRT